MNKKFLVLGFALIMLFSFSSCKKDKKVKLDEADTQKLEMLEKASDGIKVSEKGVNTSKEAMAFIEKNINLFPSDQEKYGEFLDETLTLDSYRKNFKENSNKLYKSEITVLSSKVTQLSNGENAYLIFGVDGDYSVWTVFFTKDIIDISGASIVTITGMPYATSTNEEENSDSFTDDMVEFAVVASNLELIN